MGGTATINETDAKTDEKVDHFPRYNVFCHNDDQTTMGFVVHVLQTIFNMKLAEAMRVMLEVHNEDVAFVGAYTMEQAEFRIDQAHSLARANKFPLKLTMEPE